jgi:hypothetical protein
VNLKTCIFEGKLRWFPEKVQTQEKRWLRSGTNRDGVGGAPEWAEQ